MAREFLGVGLKFPNIIILDPPDRSGLVSVVYHFSFHGSQDANHHRIMGKLKTKDSYEWRFLKGMMRRNLPYRQEGAYELEDTALVAKREQELPLEVISSIGA